MIEHHIITYFGGLTNNDTHAMIDKKNAAPMTALDGSRHRSKNG